MLDIICELTFNPVQFILDFKPALIAIQPNQMTVTKIVRRISATRKLSTRGEGRFLNAEARGECVHVCG